MEGPGSPASPWGRWHEIPEEEIRMTENSEPRGPRIMGARAGAKDWMKGLVLLFDGLFVTQEGMGLKSDLATGLSHEKRQATLGPD